MDRRTFLSLFYTSVLVLASNVSGAKLRNVSPFRSPTRSLDQGKEVSKGDGDKSVSNSFQTSIEKFNQAASPLQKSPLDLKGINAKLGNSSLTAQSYKTDNMFNGLTMISSPLTNAAPCRHQSGSSSEVGFILLALAVFVFSTQYVATFRPARPAERPVMLQHNLLLVVQCVG